MAHHWYQVARDRARDLGLSYAEIGRRMGGVGKSTVGHWFTRRNRPGIDTIAKIAKVLDCTATDLIAEDAQYVTDPTEREIIDRIRELPAAYRAQAVRMLDAFRASLGTEPPPPADT